MNNDEQKRFYRQCLYQALLHLLRTTALEDVSVSELCRDAGVSRMTYYRNYSSVRDVLEQHFDEAFDRYCREVERQGSADLRTVTLTFFRFLGGEERDFFCAVIDGGQETLIMDRFYAYLRRIMDMNDATRNLDDYIRSYLAGGLYKIAIDWLRNDADRTPEEMTALLERLFPVYG